jgi:hypothetical protein
MVQALKSSRAGRKQTVQMLEVHPSANGTRREMVDDFPFMLPVEAWAGFSALCKRSERLEHFECFKP